MSNLTRISHARTTAIILNSIVAFYHNIRNQLVQYCNLLNQVLFVNEGKKTKRDGLKKNMKESMKFCHSQRS